jgi:hypothetical protein
VKAVAPVRPLQRGGDPARVALGLLEADDVRVRRPDRADDLPEVDDVAAEPDVEGHHPHLHRRRRRGRDGGLLCPCAGRPGEGEREDEQRSGGRGAKSGHGERPHPPGTPLASPPTDLRLPGRVREMAERVMAVAADDVYDASAG